MLVRAVILAAILASPLSLAEEVRTKDLFTGEASADLQALPPLRGKLSRAERA